MPYVYMDNKTITQCDLFSTNKYNKEKKKQWDNEKRKNI